MTVKTGAGKGSCVHWEVLKLIDDGLSTFAKIHYSMVSGLWSGARDLKVIFRKCMVCKRMDGMSQACLHCIYSGCLKEGHMKAHYEEKDHCLCCDLTSGTIYCFKCADYVFDWKAEMLAKRNLATLSIVPRQLSGVPMAAKLFLEEDEDGSPKTEAYVVRSDATYGLRGLVNLGHTCFMNSVIQALVHTPILTDFFLSVGNIVCNSSHCNDKTKQQQSCLIGPIAKLFQDIYNRSKEPLGLHFLLPIIWENAPHLVGSQQHDAHEFLIAILEAIHSHFPETGQQSIVNATFFGELQSVVTCTVCSNQSITVDPFWDISLDIASTSEPTNSKRPIDLTDLLRRYTQVESLGPSSMIECSDCKRKTECTKQLQFYSLPKILVFHLKRFEHSGGTPTTTSSSKKISTRVSFLECLDMTVFKTKVSHDSSISNNEEPAIEINLLLHEKLLNQKNYYSLYAVVNHTGTFRGGHYYAYLKHGLNRWVKCDDHTITLATKEEVFNSQGYLLFYRIEIMPVC